ncbi:MAG: antibiotic biosynthesis monooxygenase [Acidobacteriales bacterium]|nr:antibiotic biosynthesis monooxygenase [Terriglobales bacterium]
MIQILWVFEVRPGREAEFEQAYRSDGDWSQLFRKGEGYLGTTMLSDAENPSRWLIADRWSSLASFEAFQRAHREIYDELNRHCQDFTCAGDEDWNLRGCGCGGPTSQ